MSTWEWDLGAGRVLWSGDAEALLGMPHSELGPGPLDCLAQIHPHDRALVRRAFFGALRHGSDVVVELRVRHADGSERWLDCRGQVVGVDAAGRPRRVMGTLMDVTERHATTEALAHSALHDPLTGLANRRLLYQRLDEALASARGRGGQMGLCVIDLDRFKEVNDSLGHHAGDALLCQVSQRMGDGLDAGATLGRLGGDEFGLVLPGADAAALRACAERIVRLLAAPFVLDGQPVSVGCSLGAALFPAHGADSEELLSQADRAMYAAKRAGGGLALAAPRPAADLAA
jgi:diguanylate cyclase (GGDEF)-like protein/PAS domain S-box-containing protein